MPMALFLEGAPLLRLLFGGGGTATAVAAAAAEGIVANAQAAAAGAAASELSGAVLASGAS